MVKKFLVFAASVSFLCLATSAYSTKCTKYFEAPNGDIGIAGNYYKVYTAWSDQSYTSPNGKTMPGLGSIIFPPSYQNKKTQYRLRPRNHNCTWGPTGTVYNKNKDFVLLHSDPACRSNRKGYWTYTVPSRDKVMDSDKTQEIIVQLPDGTTTKKNVPYISIGFGLFGTKDGSPANPQYTTYVVFMPYPYDDVSVYIATICI